MYRPSTQAGTKYLKMGFIQLLTFSPLPALASSRKLSQPQPNFQQQKTEKMKAPSGSRLVLTMKSQKSSHAEPGAKGALRARAFPHRLFQIRHLLQRPYPRRIL